MVLPIKTFHRTIKNKHRQNCVSIKLLLKMADLVSMLYCFLETKQMKLGKCQTTPEAKEQLGTLKPKKEGVTL